MTAFIFGLFVGNLSGVLMMALVSANGRCQDDDGMYLLSAHISITREVLALPEPVTPVTKEDLLRYIPLKREIEVRQERIARMRSHEQYPEMHDASESQHVASATAKLYGSATADLYDRSVSIYLADYWALPVVRIAGDVND